MRKSVYPRFLVVYGAIILISLFIVSTLGRTLTENRLIAQDARILYTAGREMASGQAALDFSDRTDIPAIYEALCTLSTAERIDIRILSPSGYIIIDTTAPLRTDDYDRIEGFDYAAFGPGQYEIGSFFSQYDSDRLNVMVPITHSMKTIGYISLHRDLADITSRADSQLRLMFLIVGIVLALMGLMLMVLQTTVFSPLEKIKTGAREIRAGHLDHRISIPNEDEIGQVADALNTLAEEIRKTGEYQSTFISNVSHDFRSPLTSIKGFTEAMLDGTIPPEKHDRYLQIIQNEADRLEKLTRNTLSLENLQRNPTGRSPLIYSTFDINRVIKKTAAVFEGSCRPRKITISLILMEGELMVSADKDKIQQVLYNLIDNAIKFSPDNATITLESRLRHGKCEISVADEGIGIAPENLNRIWDRFYKTDASRGIDKKGTGLGLSIVREIIKAHDQTITVTSTENVGSRFVFTLALGRQTAD